MLTPPISASLFLIDVRQGSILQVSFWWQLIILHLGRWTMPIWVKGGPMAPKCLHHGDQIQILVLLRRMLYWLSRTSSPNSSKFFAFLIISTTSWVAVVITAVSSTSGQLRKFPVPWELRRSNVTYFSQLIAKVNKSFPDGRFQRWCTFFCTLLSPFNSRYKLTTGLSSHELPDGERTRACTHAAISTPPVSLAECMFTHTTIFL